MSSTVHVIRVEEICFKAGHIYGAYISSLIPDLNRCRHHMSEETNCPMPHTLICGKNDEEKLLSFSTPDLNADIAIRPYQDKMGLDISKLMVLFNALKAGRWFTKNM